MKRKKAKIIARYLCLEKDRTESDGYARVQTFINFLGYSFYKTKREGRLRTHSQSIGVNYFKMADIDNLLFRIDGWYRRRLRMAIWKQWERIKAKLTSLIKLGFKKSKVWEWANIRKGYWQIANSYLLSVIITTERKKSRLRFSLGLLPKVRVVN